MEHRSDDWNSRILMKMAKYVETVHIFMVNDTGLVWYPTCFFFILKDDELVFRESSLVGRYQKIPIPVGLTWAEEGLG